MNGNLHAVIFNDVVIPFTFHLETVLSLDVIFKKGVKSIFMIQTVSILHAARLMTALI